MFNGKWMVNYTHNQACHLVLCGLLLQQCNKHRSSSTSFTYPFYLHWLCYRYYTSFPTSLSNGRYYNAQYNLSANTSDSVFPTLHYIPGRRAWNSYLISVWEQASCRRGKSIRCDHRACHNGKEDAQSADTLCLRHHVWRKTGNQVYNTVVVAHAGKPDQSLRRPSQMTD